ncbi:hypothetical protein OGAPHI_002584 [Ogataea philodendri]|uniref:Signal peptide peptidase n=1 Tax=Ogataea philodendri TaxID=1378263 RepID=A0A9P8PC94_9ASCO|nr:uncharacterized protein OGAPHI_002584 [Ogataea philodendri]KAH3668829.1 hypothetical protein OGAPHI_002584 [Ogataea philodendri]
MMSLAVFLVVVGSYTTIERPANAKRANINHPLFDPTDRDETSIPDAAIDEKNATAMPILAGIVLVGLYFAINNYGIEKISTLLNGYLVLMSIKSNAFAVTYTIKTINRKIAHSLGRRPKHLSTRFAFTISEDQEIHSSGVEENFLLPDSTEAEKIVKSELLLETRSDIKKESQLFNYYFSYADVYGWILGSLTTAIYIACDGKNNWILSNTLGASFTLLTISISRLPSFKPAAIMLVLFFIYDIYFVFGSDVMLSVATKIDIPVKLLIPRGISVEKNNIEMSILGLGDIIIPALFVSLCLRFDLYSYHQTHPDTEFHHLQKYPKPYFWSALSGYIFGLSTTIAVLHRFQHGQPALLYLCPSLLLFTLATAVYRKDLRKVWQYNEEEDLPQLDPSTDNVVSPETMLLVKSAFAEDEDDDSDYEPEPVSDSD